MLIHGKQVQIAITEFWIFFWSIYDVES